MVVDLLHLIRNLRRSPAAVLAAILTLALTLGTGASIFAVVDAVLLTPPPFHDPDTLVTIGETPATEPPGDPRAADFPTLAAWRARAASLATLEAFDPTNVTLTGFGPAERVSATNVTAGFLTLLGVRPSLGRSIDAGDEGRPVVLVTNAFWRGKLGADPAVIGRELVLGGQKHTIVGVLPAGFWFALNPSDIWRPLAPAATAARAGIRVRVVGRLHDGTPAAHLASALDEISGASTRPARVVVTTIAAASEGVAPRILGLFAAAAALTVLLAFANLAGLLIVRSLDRQRELAVRIALGANRRHVATQLILESQALVAAGLCGGAVLAWWTTPLASRLVLEEFGHLAAGPVVLSWRVMAIVAAAAGLLSWLCAWLPSAAAARRSVADILRRAATPPPRELRWRRLLVSGEIAVAFVLLASALGLGRSLVAALEAETGFDRGPEVLTLRVSLPQARYADDAQVASFYALLHSALEQRLRPDSVSIVDEVPLTGDRGRSAVSLRSADAGYDAVIRTAGNSYFSVMGIPVFAGREFEGTDGAASTTRVVLSRRLAERLFPFEQATGRSVWLSATGRAAEVVGVVGDVTHRSVDDTSTPTVYLYAGQFPSRSSHVVVRGTRADTEVIDVVREEVGRLDPGLPVYGVRSMQDIVAASPGVPVRRVLTTTLAAFTLLAVLLGGLGLFGTVAHDVATRRTEVAIRMALGAGPRRILMATLRQGAVTGAAGIASGALLSAVASNVIGGAMSGVVVFDRYGISVALGTIVVACLGASLPAARRAARIGPLPALRGE